MVGEIYAIEYGGLCQVIYVVARAHTIPTAIESDKTLSFVDTLRSHQRRCLGVGAKLLAAFACLASRTAFTAWAAAFIAGSVAAKEVVGVDGNNGTGVRNGPRKDRDP